jgi:hypothetical protein
MPAPAVTDKANPPTAAATLVKDSFMCGVPPSHYLVPNFKLPSSKLAQNICHWLDYLHPGILKPHAAMHNAYRRKFSLRYIRAQRSVIFR